MVTRERSSSIAKITRPDVSGIVYRKRLFTKLDQSRKKTVTWISAPGGSGKTTLLSSYVDARKLSYLWYQLDARDEDPATFFYYLRGAARKAAPRFRKPLPLLTPEYLPTLHLFTKNHFQELYRRLKRPFLIIFDNYQEISVDSKLHGIIIDMMLSVPEGIRIVVLSRGDPLPAFSRLRANGHIECVGWEEIKCTLKEAGEIIKKSGCSKILDGVVEQFHLKTEGWIAGLVLLIETLKRNEGKQEIISADQAHIFDYFASEIFQKADAQTRDFLLKTAFLPQIEPSLAAGMTGSSDAEQILSTLARNHYFTTKHASYDSVYQYHPLFREFLISKALSGFGKQKMKNLKRSAAELLSKNGKAEDAIDLYLEAGDWEDASKLICSTAAKLLAQGRSEIVRGWLDNMPPDLVEQNAQLLYWRGASIMALNPMAGSADYEKAFHFFKRTNDLAKIFLCWSAVCDISVQTLEFGQIADWMRELHDLLQKDNAYPSKEIEAQVIMSKFNALSMGLPHHPDIDVIREKAFSLICGQNIFDKNLYLLTSNCLIVHYLWHGDHYRAGFVMDLFRKLIQREKENDLLMMTLNATEALYFLFTASFADCVEKVSEALRIAEKTGIHLWDNHILCHALSAALNMNDENTFTRLLPLIKNIEQCRRIDQTYYYVLLSWQAILAKKIEAACYYQDLSCKAADGTGFHAVEADCMIIYSELLAEKGEAEKAEQFLNKGLEQAQKIKSDYLLYHYLLVRSSIAFQKGDTASGLHNLSEAMTTGRRRNLKTFYYFRPDKMALLCEKALENGIEVDYVQDLIRKRGLVPVKLPVHLECWPWPIKIYLLGRFEIYNNPKQVLFSGKVQQRPLAMLKVLIAFGGQNVSEDTVMDALWPNADGDLAKKSFDTTLHRLRKLLGNERAVLLHEKQLSVDKRQCWVDVWSFEEAVQSENEIKKLEWAVALYRGHFLPMDIQQFWTISLRGKLRAKYLSVVSRLGSGYVEQGQFEKAIQVYEQGLERDDTQEEFYQELMVCYQKLGKLAEAKRVYNRCRTVLSATV